MGTKILSLLVALLILSGINCTTVPAQTFYSWRQEISSNCQGLNTATSCGGTACNTQDLCWDTTLKVNFTCDSVSANVCTWKAGGGGWVDTGAFLYPLSPAHPVMFGSSSAPEAGVIADFTGNIHLGSNLFRCDVTNGCKFDTTNSGNTDLTMKNSTITDSGGYIYTGANPFLNATRTTDKTSPAVGDWWYNSVGNYFGYWNGAIYKRIPTEPIFSTTVLSPVTSNTLLWQTPYNMRVETIRCIVDPGGSSSAVINIQGCNSNGVSCTSVDTSSITCGNTNSSDDGTLTSPTIVAGNWVNLNIGTVTGSPAKLTVTVKYSVQP